MNMKKFWLSICSSLLLILAIVSPVQATEEGASARQQLEQFLSGLNSLQVDFVQFVRNQDGLEQRSTGTLSVSRPNRFMWRYLSPNKLYILADGSWVWLVDEELEQVTQRGQESTLAGTPAQLLASDIQLDKEFETKEIGYYENLAWLELIPLNDDSQFENIKVGMSDGKLMRMEMLDRFGQFTRLAFINPQLNLALDAKLFVFQPPPGYDILQQYR